MGLHCLIVLCRVSLLLLADHLNSKVAGQPRNVVLATEMSITCIHCRKCLSYIKHECLQRAYNNYNELISASVTSVRQNLLINVSPIAVMVW